MDIEDLLGLSVKQRASDLHLLPGLQPLLRVNGELHPIKDSPRLTSDLIQQLVYSVMTVEQQQIFESNLLCEMAISLRDIGNFRVSVFHQLRGLAAVFRVIPEKVPSFEELDLPPILKTLLGLSHGLVLVTGPTGSGKSTTLAAMVDYINTIRACHIITIEDPIEFIYETKKSAINQLQVGRDTPDINTALRASLRQDPDVILLGEIRDLETIRLALTAAETGHLVMSTLHASSAPLAISRMVDIFPAAEKNRVRNLLSETLQAVICQTLVKKISGGRAAAFEIMLATPAIRHLVRQDMTAHMQTTIQTSGDVGMCTMDQYLQQLVSRRIITSVEARNVALYRGTFREI
ncbi:type IV pilus twitching motility protein PilT [Aquicella lusitana]|uniref:Pilus retraction ATPase PilT n=1 Tax=Aquicella lusitana TaxID=254246 RepID=A0A370GQV5_9COXI|nr:type IV pilus twitching motility protein PilT [Aquicella lusitana]RDI46092.1 pilus retraction ATPase PilT [Aquicella lusitana]VVC73311.1 Twitching mobility protein [Aquicella lusitana]